MSAPVDEGLRLLRAVEAALGTVEGRRLARVIAHRLKQAEDEAADEPAPTSYSAMLLAGAAERRRRRGGGSKSRA
jgi:hypothetical protein